MTIHVVGCGETGKEWDGHGISIGVNDAWKFGKPTTYLLVCNRPDQFTAERLRTITSSTPKFFYTHKPNWSMWFPTWKRLNVVTWYGELRKGQYYSSDTSPFIAMTLAYNLGATKIILWGVDFINHKIFNTGNPETKREIGKYQELVNELRNQGVSVYLGCKGSAMESFLTVYHEEVC